MQEQRRRGVACEVRGATGERGCTRRDRPLKTAEVKEGVNHERMTLCCDQANNDVVGAGEREAAKIWCCLR